MELVYVGTVPALATLLLAWLILVPAELVPVSRARVAAATAVALALCAFTMVCVSWLSISLGGMLSPRPFMTHYVNLLVVEPQDNSFPCPEVMVAAVLAASLYCMRPRVGQVAFGFVLLLSFDRLYCGSNYVQDVVAGVLFGTALTALCLSAWRVPLVAALHGSRRFSEFTLQGALAFAALFLTVGATWGFMAADSRFGPKLRPWAPLPPPVVATSPNGGTRAASVALQEGEGVPGTVAVPAAVPDAETEALAKRSQVFLPIVEKYLKGKLTPVARPFRLLDVEVAPVKAGTSEYRAAALRFDIGQASATNRTAVAATCRRLVESAFADDDLVQNVDVTAIVRGDGRVIDGMDLAFAGDEVPVLTASIQRKNLLLPAATDNLATLDPLRWLQLRSRLFISSHSLPAPTTASLAQPGPSPVLAPQPNPPTTRPSVAPHPTARPAVVVPPPVVGLPRVPVPLPWTRAPHSAVRPLLPHPGTTPPPAMTSPGAARGAKPAPPRWAAPRWTPREPEAWHYHPRAAWHPQLRPWVRPAPRSVAKPQPRPVWRGARPAWRRPAKMVFRMAPKPWWHWRRHAPAPDPATPARTAPFPGAPVTVKPTGPPRLSTPPSGDLAPPASPPVAPPIAGGGQG